MCMNMGCKVPAQCCAICGQEFDKIEDACRHRWVPSPACDIRNMNLKIVKYHTMFSGGAGITVLEEVTLATDSGTRVAYADRIFVHNKSLENT